MPPPETETPHDAPGGTPDAATAAGSLESRPQTAESRPKAATRAAGLARRHPALVIGATVVGLLVALIVNVARPADYIAESRLLVGTFEVPSEAIPGYVLASQSLAENYERVAETELVVGQVADALGVTPEEVRRRVSVTDIPNSAIVRVRATDPVEARAAEIADTMAEGIERAIDELASRGDSAEALTSFEDATRELVAAELAESEARADLATAQATGGQATVTAAQQALTDAELAVATAEITAESLAEQYLETQQRASSSSSVRTLGGSIVTEGSRLVPTLVTFVLGGLVGAGAGLGLAWWHEQPPARSRSEADADGEADAEVGENGDADTAPEASVPEGPRTTSRA